MKLRYFVGHPEDAFRKRGVLFTSVRHADHNMRYNTLFVYGTADELLLMLDFEDLGERFHSTYRGSCLEFSFYDYCENFSSRLLRYRRRTELKRAA